MSFAKQAAELLTDPYEMRVFTDSVDSIKLAADDDAARARRRRLLAILATVGGLGALGAGYYYREPLVKALGISSTPEAEEMPPTGAESVADTASELISGEKGDFTPRGGDVARGLGAMAVGSRPMNRLTKGLTGQTWLSAADSSQPNLREALRTIINKPDVAATMAEEGTLKPEKRNLRSQIFGRSGVAGKDPAMSKLLASLSAGGDTSKVSSRAAQLLSLLNNDKGYRGKVEELATDSRAANREGSRLGRLLNRTGAAKGFESMSRYLRPLATLESDIRHVENTAGKGTASKALRGRKAGIGRLTKANLPEGMTSTQTADLLSSYRKAPWTNLRNYGRAGLRGGLGYLAGPAYRGLQDISNWYSGTSEGGSEADLAEGVQRLKGQ